MALARWLFQKGMTYHRFEKLSFRVVSFKVSQNSRILMMDGKDEEAKKEEFHKKNVKEVNRVN